MPMSAVAAAARSAPVRARRRERMWSRNAALTVVASDRICGKPITMPVPFGTIPPDAALSVDDRSLLRTDQRENVDDPNRAAANPGGGGVSRHRATKRRPGGRDKRYGLS